jgi:hypothetical protein
MRLVRVLPPLILLAVLALLAVLLVAGGGLAYLPFVLMPVVMLVPALFVPGGQPPSTDSDDDDDGGQRRGRPRSWPPGPSGGIPLPDAIQSRLRVRDQGPVKLRPPRSRRPVADPARSPGRRQLPGRRPRA